MPLSKVFPVPREAVLISAIAKTKSSKNFFKNYQVNNNLEISPEVSNLLSPVEELFISGGGGAGRTLPGALVEARKYGLKLDNIKVVCASSVGSILALAITLNIPADKILDLLNRMPTDKFQDWDIESILHFPDTWGLCKGEAMPNYFRKLILEQTGLKDPTFRELYDAGYKKELRVLAANLDDLSGITVFSHCSTPHKKVADAVALSCSVPFLYPPQWIVKDGKRGLHTDGGLLKNYPFGVGSDANTPLHKQLGFIFVNGATARDPQDAHRPAIKTFIDYLGAVLGALFFQHAHTVSEPVKARTVAIRVQHATFKFTATPEEQRILDEAGAEGVRSLINQMLLDQRESYQNVLQHEQHQHQLKQNQNKAPYKRSKILQKR